MICPTDPPQNKQKNSENIPSKGQPRASSLVEFKEKFPDQFSHNMQITSESLFRSVRQAKKNKTTTTKKKTDTHALNYSWGCAKIVRNCDPLSLLMNTFSIHLEPGCKSHGQIIHCRNAENVQKTGDSLALFLDEFL